MIRAYHAIITAYGFWLPNDPRGSWSDYVRVFEVLRHGRATKVTTRRSLATRLHDRQVRLLAKRALRYPEVVFTGRQARSIGDGFHQAIAESGYVVYACCILPKHTHVVFARHPFKAERVVGHFKGRATQRLLADGVHPLAKFRACDGTRPSPWARKSWPVFLETEAEILRAIRYVEENPLKEGKPPQRWDFVLPFTH